MLRPRSCAATLRSASIIISTYQRPAALHRVLDGCSRQKVSPNQILVADDGSGLETRLVIERWRAFGLPIEHCWQEDLGFRKTKILNKALQRATGDLLIFLDGDCIPFPTFVGDHIRLASFQHLMAGTRVLASAAFTDLIECSTDWSVPDSWGFWLSKRLIRQTNKSFPLLRLGDGGWRSARPRNWRLLRGCNFSVFLDDLLAVGGFDESIIGWGREDSELAVRLINAGLRVKSLAFAAPVLHLWHSEASRDRLTANNEWLNRSIRERRVVAERGLQRPE